MDMPLWCIVKSAVVRKEPNKNSPVVVILHFGSKMYTHERRLAGNIRISYRLTTGDKATVYGYISSQAVTVEPVLDLAGLYYYNCTGKRVPMADRYNGKNVIRMLEPMEHVKVYAQVGEWCITNKGWSLFKWFAKDREVFGIDNVRDLHHGVLVQAVKDYSNDVKRLKNRSYGTLDAYCELVWDIDKIMAWFLEKKHMTSSDKVLASKRVEDLNEALGIDQEWIDRKHRVVKALQKKGLVKKKKKVNEDD